MELSEDIYKENRKQSKEDRKIKTIIKKNYKDIIVLIGIPILFFSILIITIIESSFAVVILLYLFFFINEYYEQKKEIKNLIEDRNSRFNEYVKCKELLNKKEKNC